MVDAYISIGSNINPNENIMECLRLLESKFPIIKVSNYYETKPYGYDDQENFINLAVKIKTELKPYALLKKLQEIERKLNRERKIKNGPRTMDLDVLLYGDNVIKDKKLHIPHKGLFERDFMLIPLLDIAPDIIDPITNKKAKYFIKYIKHKQIIKTQKLRNQNN